MQEKKKRTLSLVFALLAAVIFDVVSKRNDS